MGGKLPKILKDLSEVIHWLKFKGVFCWIIVTEIIAL